MSSLKNAVFPVARVLLAQLFIVSGIGKVADFSATQAYMEAMQVPGLMLPLVILLELGGGLAMVLGWQTRAVAAALAGFSLVAAFLFHFQLSDQIQSIMFMKNLAIAGGLLLLVVNGAGAWSLDREAGGA